MYIQPRGAIDALSPLPFFRLANQRFEPTLGIYWIQSSESDTSSMEGIEATRVTYEGMNRHMF